MCIQCSLAVEIEVRSFEVSYWGGTHQDICRGREEGKGNNKMEFWEKSHVI